MRIVWSGEAFGDLERLDRFLRPKSPEAADRAYLEIHDAILQLEDFPEIGRVALDIGPGFRELPIPFSASGYLVLYLLGDDIIVAHVRHLCEAGY